MEFDAAFHEKQSQSGAGACSDVAAAMEGFEQMLLVLVGNADSMVTNGAHGIGGVLLDGKVDGRAALRIFDGITEEIGENVAEQPFIRMGVQRE